MKNLQIKICHGGFQYRIEDGYDASFTFRYFVLGTGGKFQSGEISSSIAQARTWIKISTDFPVMHVGITSIEFDLPRAEAAAAPAKRSHSPKRPAVKENQDNPVLFSRRKVLQAASFLLAGNMIFPGSLSASQPVPKQSGTYDPYEQSVYQPYGGTH